MAISLEKQFTKCDPFTMAIDASVGALSAGVAHVLENGSSSLFGGPSPKRTLPGRNIPVFRGFKNYKGSVHVNPNPELPLVDPITYGATYSTLHTGGEMTVEIFQNQAGGLSEDIVHPFR